MITIIEKGTGLFDDHENGYFILFGEKNHREDFVSGKAFLSNCNDFDQPYKYMDLDILQENKPPFHENFVHKIPIQNCF